MDYLSGLIQKHIGVKESRNIIRYFSAILVLSLVTLFTYFYYNAFSPILSIMAKEYGFSDEEKDIYLGILLLFVILF